MCLPHVQGDCSYILTPRATGAARPSPRGPNVKNNVLSYTLSHEYLVAGNQYSRLLFMMKIAFVTIYMSKTIDNNYITMPVHSANNSYQYSPGTPQPSPTRDWILKPNIRTHPKSSSGRGHHQTAQWFKSEYSWRPWRDTGSSTEESGRWSNSYHNSTLQQ